MLQHIILSLAGQWRYEITSKLFVCSPTLSNMPLSIMGSEVILSSGGMISVLSCNPSGSLMDFFPSLFSKLVATVAFLNPLSQLMWWMKWRTLNFFSISCSSTVSPSRFVRQGWLGLFVFLSLRNVICFHDDLQYKILSGISNRALNFWTAKRDHGSVLEFTTDVFGTNLINAFLQS